MLHEITYWFNALRLTPGHEDRDEETIHIGEVVDVTGCWFEGGPRYPIAVIKFNYEGDPWDAIFDTPDDNGVLAPIGTFRRVD